MLESRDIKVLALDADNTLYKIKGVREIYREVIRELNWGFSKEPGELYEELRQLMKRKEITYIYITKQSWFLTLTILSKLSSNMEINIEKIYEDANSLYENFKHLIEKKMELTLIGKALPTLSRDFKIVVVSEEEKTFLLYKLKTAKLMDYIEDVISSSDVGYLKPNDLYFKLLITKTGVNLREILYVDDDPRNVDAAKKFGLNSITNIEFEEIISDII